MNNKGIELATSTIVILIIMTVLFIGGLKFIYDIYRGATIAGAEIDRTTREQIESILKTSNALVVIPFNKAEVTRGKTHTFGLGLRNIGPPGSFSIRIEFDSAYDPAGQLLPADKAHIDQHWLGNFATIENIPLEKNAFTTIPLTIAAQGTSAPEKPAPDGTYVFNLCIYKKPTPDACQQGQDPTVFYDKKIHQLFIGID